MHRRRAALAAIIFVIIGAAGVLVLRSFGPAFHWAEFTASFKTLDPGWAVASLVSNLLTYGARILRWRVMMKPVREGASYWTLTSATAIGFTAVIFFGRPGEFVRPWLIARGENVSFSSQAAAWFLERIFDLLSVVLLFGAALAGLGMEVALPEKMRELLHAGGWLALVLGLACVAFVGVAGLFSDQARQFCARLAAFLPTRLARIARGSLDSFLTGLGSTTSLKHLAVILFWTAVEWWLVCAGIYALFHSFAPTAAFSWNDTMVFTGFVAFGSIIQLPGIGGGMQVASVLILTELFGLALEPATACTLLVWGVSWLSIIPFGLLFAFLQGLHWDSLHKVGNLEKEAAPHL